MKSFRNLINGNLIFTISPSKPCPCGSGKPYSKCCLTPRGFFKQQASVTPSLPRTGESLKECYAACLEDCNSKLSREHYITKSLLQYLNIKKDLRVSGFHWLEGKEKVLPPDALSANILCERHNSALSPLDEIAVRLFNAFDEEGVANSGKKLLFLFNGYDLERLLLKILCGLIYSKNIVTDRKCDYTIPRSWIDVLFGYKNFSNEQGLYICKTIGHLFEGPRGLALRAITNKGNLTGLGLCLCGYELVLSLTGFPSRTFDGRAFAYRPFELYTTGPDFEKSIIINWDGVADLGTISFKIRDTKISSNAN